MLATIRAPMHDHFRAYHPIERSVNGTVCNSKTLNGGIACIYVGMSAAQKPELFDHRKLRIQQS